MFKFISHSSLFHVQVYFTMQFYIAVWTVLFIIATVNSSFESLNDPITVFDEFGDESNPDRPSNDGWTVTANPSREETSSIITGKTACSGDSSAKFRKRDLNPTEPWTSFNRECPNPSIHDVNKQPAPGLNLEPKTFYEPKCREGYIPVCCWEDPDANPKRRRAATMEIEIVENCEPCTFGFFRCSE